MPKYSIIVPVYNTEKYLEKCIESLRKQTYTDFEVILVDDCSTDGSYDICKNISECDNRFKVIRQKENKGQSAARNLGLDNICGEYVIFVDSDDYVETDFLEALEVSIDNHPCDLITWGLYDDVLKDDDSIVISKSPLNYPEDKFVPNPDEKDILELWMKTFFASPCNKAYKAEIIRNNRIYFDEICVEFEDLVFNAKYCMYIESFSILNKPYYHYLQPEWQISALKRKWSLVEPFKVSQTVYHTLEVYLNKFSVRGSSLLDDIMLYAYKAYSNEIEYAYRTKKWKEFKTVVYKLSDDEWYLKMLGLIHNPKLKKVIQPTKVLIKLKCRNLLTLFIWFLEKRTIG